MASLVSAHAGSGAGPRFLPCFSRVLFLTHHRHRRYCHFAISEQCQRPGLSPVSIIGLTSFSLLEDASHVFPTPEVTASSRNVTEFDL